MSEPLITECPGCHSRFRVTEGQLNVANGQVRCGSCLRVFDARKEHDRLELRQRQKALQEAIAATTGAHVEPPPAPPTTATARAPQSRAQSPASSAAGGGQTPPTNGDRPPDGPANRNQARSADGIPHLYAEPILLDADPETTDPVATAGWALATLAALALLVLQYAWFERATLARDPDLAPLYTLACDSLPCDLGHNAIDQILNERMIVRPHPAFADALSVDLRLLNQAAFAQPFPALQLRFSDLKGNPVALRTFLPREYLRNEALDPMRMPPGTPVELRLDITDPGVQALSYSLELKPAR